jgi:hypothetical protein
MTPEALRLYQGSHRNHLGQPLRADGVLGPETQWALDYATLCEARRQIITRAQAHLGLTEDPPGSNADRAGLIRGWLARCGAVPGDPWCAAFTSHCLSGLAGTGRRVECAGARALGKLFPPSGEPRPGDIFWYSVGVAGHGHVGLVLGVAGAEVMTIEGNCANMVRCVRRPRAGLNFARTVEAVAGGEGGKVPGVVPSVPAAPGGTR